MRRWEGQGRLEAMATTEAFEKAYAGLNAEQKLAVDTVEGPVLVVAGPGTGKTHILTLRIANILRVTQAAPGSILALTFTDSGARTMRRRLALIIGDEAARKVTCTTFHGFAELVRAEYPEHFAASGARRLMGDVEETLLLREAIETADIELLRPSKAPYTYLRDLRSLYDSLTREGVTFDAYRVWGREERRRIESDDALRYKRGAQEGEFTKAGLEKVARLDKVEEAVRVFERYQELKDERGVQDFIGLLVDAIECIAGDEALRADLQERYQYVLADEHQDANALQHRLLELLAYDDHPNLFVVGDEKQAIYRFQGAELGGFKSFTELFPRTTVINLVSSFRSYQHILDSAHTVIEESGEQVRLTASRGAGAGEHVSRIVADDPLDERSRVVGLVAKLIKEGALPHEIVVIARTNDTANLYAQALSARGVPTLRAGDISLTARPLMRALISLMEYVADPTRLGALRSALLAPWWGVPTNELLTLLRTSSDRELIAHLASAYPAVAQALARAVDEGLAATPIECFSFLFTASGARTYFLSHAEHLDDIALVRKLVMHLEEAALLTEATTFAEAMLALSRAREEGLSPVKVSVTEREGCVTVITAHKAKGMEFRFVIIPDCTENAWEKGGKSPMIPSPFESRQSLTDAHRLFYVALTRARDHAYLSYARESAEGRERTPTSLIPHGLKEIETEGAPLPLLHTTVAAPAVLKELIERYLENEGLSPSAVNEYLTSPPTFFARRVLRIKEPPVPALIYGSAVHAALAALLMGRGLAEARTELERVFARSLLLRGALFEKLRADALAALDACSAELAEIGTPHHVEKKFSLSRDVDGMPVTLEGKMDAVFKSPSGFIVADWKTGSTVSAKNEEYARQLALYAELLRANGERADSAELLGVSEDGIKRVSVPVTEAECAAALADVDTVVRELRSGQWRRGEPSPYDALLELLKD